MSHINDPLIADLETIHAQLEQVVGVLVFDQSDSPTPEKSQHGTDRQLAMWMAYLEISMQHIGEVIAWMREAKA